MTRGKGMFLTATIAAMAGALILMLSRINPGFYDVFTRVVDVPGYWFCLICTFNFITKDVRRH